MPSLRQHVVLTIGRSGSNTLVNALNQHSNVLNYGEVLGDWNTIRKVYNRWPGVLKSDEAGYLDSLLHNRLIARGLNGYRNISYLRRGQKVDMKSFRQIQTIGIKEFSLNLRRKGLLDFLVARPHIKVIGLQRTHVLDRFMSWKMLQKTGVVKLAATDNTQAQKIQLDTGTLLAELQTIQDENQELATLLDALPETQVHRIQYDDFYGSSEQTKAILQDTFRFLDLPAFEPTLQMRKILKGSTLDRIENLGDCRAAVKDTAFVHLFDASQSHQTDTAPLDAS